MRYKTIILSLIIFWIINPAIAGWEMTYGGIYNERAFSIIINSNCDYVMIGGTQSFSYPYSDFFVIKVNPSGDELWERTYGHGSGLSVVQTNDGGYIAAGYLHLPPETFTHHYLVKMDERGDSVWTHTYGATSYTGPTTVAQTHDDGYIIAWHWYPGGGRGFHAVRTDSLGDTIWTRIYLEDDSIAHRANSLIETPDGGYIIVGAVSYDTCYYDVAVVKIDSLGELVWTKKYGSLGYDAGHFIDTTADGNYIITGVTSIYMTGTYRDVYLLKIDPEGDTLWTRKYGGYGFIDEGWCVRQTMDGGYIIAGYTYSYGIGTPDSSNVYLIKTDSLGNMEWERFYGGPCDDMGYSVSQTEDGGYIIAGYYDQGPHTDVYLIKTDSLGYTEIEETYSMRPKEIALSVYPNPFNSAVNISLNLWERASALDNRDQPVGSVGNVSPTIEIFDINGRIVYETSVGARRASPVLWQPEEGIASGVFLVRAKIEDKDITKRVVYLK